MSFFKKLFGDYSKKEIKRITPLKDKVLALEEEYSKLSDSELQAKTPEFKERLAGGETLDDILPEAFAACREASWRVLKLKHYPVQILGGIVLHQGRIAEMKTGEGKTLVATPPTSTRWAARASTSSRSTITSPAATPNGWARSIASWG